MDRRTAGRWAELQTYAVTWDDVDLKDRYAASSRWFWSTVQQNLQRGGVTHYRCTTQEEEGKGGVSHLRTSGSFCVSLILSNKISKTQPTDQNP